MRSALCGLLLFTAVLTGETDAGRLTSTLLALKNGTNLSDRLADDILALADPRLPPSRSTVFSFADELARGLSGRPLSNSDAALLQRSISNVLHGVGATFHSAAYVRQVLSRSGVESSKAQVITKRFIAIGEEVRGPDDIPVQRLLDRNRK